MEDKNKTCKLFCGGLPHALTEDQLSEYFSQYGTINNFEFIYDKGTQQRKHFCFIVFQDSDAVEKITTGKVPPGSVVHHIGTYRVECKKKFEDNHPVQKKIKNQVGEGSAPPRGKWPAQEEPAYPRGKWGAAEPEYPAHTYRSQAGGYHAQAGYETSGYEGGYGAAYPAHNQVSGYSSYPGYNTGYPDQRLQKGGGPMKQRGGMGGGGRGGAYRPY